MSAMPCQACRWMRGHLIIVADLAVKAYQWHLQPCRCKRSDAPSHWKWDILCLPRIASPVGGCGKSLTMACQTCLSGRVHVTTSRPQNGKPCTRAQALQYAGPDAPLDLERGLCASHMEHAYDFYKPCGFYPLVGLLIDCCIALLQTSA